MYKESGALLLHRFFHSKTYWDPARHSKTQFTCTYGRNTSACILSGFLWIFKRIDGTMCTYERYKTVLPWTLTQIDKDKISRDKIVLTASVATAAARYPRAVFFNFFFTRRFPRGFPHRAVDPFSRSRSIIIIILHGSGFRTKIRVPTRGNRFGCCVFGSGPTNKAPAIIFCSKRRTTVTINQL